MILKINTHYINLDRIACIDVDATVISFLPTMITGDKITFERGGELTTTKFDALKAWIENNRSYHEIV